MTIVEVSKVGKSFDGVAALTDVDLMMSTGEFMAVLGPSGCGKSTLLRCIAGFERIDQGRITLGGHVVTLPGVHMPPHRRQVAIVPQDGALFPHLSVAENIGFGLKGSGRKKRVRIDECLDLVGLSGMGSRMPHELSGGQQQRVAVARALAPHPPLVLLDEPFSALDASLRAGLRSDIKQALIHDGATTLLVTHDQGEALSMADTVAVMSHGHIRQVGSPTEIYRHPVDEWVGQFVGEAVILPVLEMLPGRMAATSMGPLALRPDSPQDGATLLVRPEQINIARAAERRPVQAQSATIQGVAYHGHDALITLETGKGTVQSRVLDRAMEPYLPGEEVYLWVSGQCEAFAAPRV